MPHRSGLALSRRVSRLQGFADSGTHHETSAHDRCSIYCVRADCRGAQAGTRSRRESEKKPSVTEGIALAHPIRDREVMQTIRETDGDAIAVSDEETLAAQRELAQIGLHVEPTSAVVVATLTRN